MADWLRDSLDVVTGPHLDVRHQFNICCQPARFTGTTSLCVGFKSHVSSLCFIDCGHVLNIGNLRGSIGGKTFGGP